MGYVEDILQTDDPEKGGDDRFSFSRSILGIGVILYIITIITGIVFFIKVDPSFDVEMFKAIESSLRWFILTFAAYSFGGKVFAYGKNTSKESK